MHPLSPSSLAWRLRATRVVVVAGMVLAYLSYGVYKLGGPYELYPFFHWRLYSAPVGVEGHATYRIYTQAAPGAPWIRNPVRPTPFFDISRYTLVLGKMTEAVLTDSLGDRDARAPLEAFVEHAVPGARRYGVVAEFFHPLVLLHDSTAYDTTVVYCFDGSGTRPRAAE
jgi:hypothetical protein